MMKHEKPRRRRRARNALGITYYPLPKIHESRFINHHCRGFKALLHNWPALKTAFENSLNSDRDCWGRPELVRKLKSYRFLTQVPVYLDILESIGPLSLVFENNMLLAFDVQSAVETSIVNLEAIKEEEFKGAIDSFLRKLTLHEEYGLKQ